MSIKTHFIYDLYTWRVLLKHTTFMIYSYTVLLHQCSIKTLYFLYIFFLQSYTMGVVKHIFSEGVPLALLYPVYCIYIYQKSEKYWGFCCRSHIAHPCLSSKQGRSRAQWWIIGVHLGFESVFVFPALTIKPHHHKT